MPKNYARRYRIASLIQQALAPMLSAACKRGSLITLRQINLTNDFSVATVVYAVVGEERQHVQGELDEAAPALRLQLARRLNMRKTPKLVFLHDDEGLAADDMRKRLDKMFADDNA